MATKKEKRAAALDKRAKMLEAHKKVGLQAQQRNGTKTVIEGQRGDFE